MPYVVEKAAGSGLPQFIFPFGPQYFVVWSAPYFHFLSQQKCGMVFHYKNDPTSAVSHSFGLVERNDVVLSAG